MTQRFPVTLLLRLRHAPLGVLLVTSLAGCPYIGSGTHSDNTQEGGTDVGIDPDPDTEPDIDTDTDTDTAGYPDVDGDGFTSDVDCDDNDPLANPQANERCDGADTNCNGEVDEGFPPLFLDYDQDGFGDTPTSACNDTDPTAQVDGDCDDTKAEAFPNNPEVCDEVDNDCNDLVDDGLPTRYRDADFDGIGAGLPLDCASPGPWSVRNDDCNDSDSRVFPGNLEICDEIDNDCRADTSEAGVATLFPGNGSAPTNLDTATTNVTPIANRPGQAELRFCEGSYAMTFQFQDNAQPLLMSGLGSVELRPVNNTERVIYVETTTLELNNLTIADGRFNGAGSGLLCLSSDVTLNAVEFNDNIASYGAAIYSDGCEFSGNQVNFVFNNGTDIGGSIVHGINQTKFDWTDATWSDNSGDLSLVLGDSNVDLTGGEIADSTTDAIYLVGESVMSLSNTSFRGNSGRAVVFSDGSGFGLGNTSSATCISPGNSCVAR